MEANCHGAWTQLTRGRFPHERRSPLGFTVEGGRNACHRGKVALGDFLPNEDAALSEVKAERLGEAQQGARNASLYGRSGRLNDPRGSKIFLLLVIGVTDCLLRAGWMYLLRGVRNENLLTLRG
jgi:hypothetical protein